MPRKAPPPLKLPAEPVKLPKQPAKLPPPSHKFRNWVLAILLIIIAGLLVHWLI